MSAPNLLGPVGVIGAGSMGTNHIRVLRRQLGRDVRVFDADQDSALTRAKQYGVTCVPDMSSLLSEVTSVVIATPPATHLEVCTQVLEKSLPVLLEKPACLSEYECRQLMQLSEKFSAPVQVGFVERWNPAFMTVKQMLAKNEQIVSVDLTRAGRLAPQTAAGVVLDLMVHDLDLVQALLVGQGETLGPSLLTIGKTSLPGEDLAFAQFVMNGTLVRIEASRLSHVRVRELRVNTSRREIVAGLARQTVEATELGEASFVATGALTLRESVTVERPFVTSWASPLESELQSFLSADNGPENPDLNDAIRVHRLVDDLLRVRG